MGGKRLDKVFELGELFGEWGAVLDEIFKGFVYCCSIKSCCSVLRLKFFENTNFVVTTGTALVVFDGRIGMSECHRK